MAGVLEGKTAVITGSSSGIGRALAIRFATEGAAVVVHGTDVSRSAAVVNEIRQSGGCASACMGNVTVPEFAAELATFALDQFGRLDIFVANAGMVAFSPFLEMSAEVFQSFLSVHVTGAFTTSQAAARCMVQKNNGGRILYMSSVSAIHAMYGYAAYCSAKSAVMALTRVAVVELAPYQITVNALAPGPVQNQMMERLWGAERLQERCREIPAGRIGRVEDVAETALFLASPAASYLTGQTIFIDGGATAAGMYTHEVFKRSTGPAS